MRVVGPLAIAFIFAAAATPLFGQLPPRYELGDLKALEQAFIKVADTVRPSVVAIQTYHVRNPTDDASKRVQLRVSQGSGFVIDADGHILTNRHVLEDANTFIIIIHSGERYEARVVQTDMRLDLAVLKIDAEGLTPVRWGDVNGVKVGQWTFACGNPFGLANESGQASVTVGTVSALGREITQRLGVDQQMQYYGNLIETSAAINPGGSGGPLFNLDGQIIGVVTAIETRTGVNEGAGFAIPIDRNTRRVLELLKAGQAVRYGFLGVSVEDVEAPPSRRVSDTRSFPGVRITKIDPSEGPAAKAGLKIGDVILEINGAAVENASHLVRLVSFTPVGSEVEVTYVRKQVKRKSTVMLGDREELLGLPRTE